MHKRNSNGEPFLVNRMLKDKDFGKFDIILIKHTDCGWRNLGEYKVFKNILVRSGAKLHNRLRNDFYDITG